MSDRHEDVLIRLLSEILGLLIEIRDQNAESLALTREASAAQQVAMEAMKRNEQRLEEARRLRLTEATQRGGEA